MKKPIISPEAMANSRYYSEHNARLLDRLSSDEKLRDMQASIQDNDHEVTLYNCANEDIFEKAKGFDVGAQVDACTSTYPYSLCNWPIFMGETARAEIEDFVDRLPGALLEVILNCFENDAEGFGRYFGVPSFFYSMLKSKGLDPRVMIMRHDMTRTDGVYKLLEINVGSNVGGWELPLFADKYKNILQEIDFLNPDESDSIYTLTRVFESHLNNGIRYRQEIGEDFQGNMLILHSPDTTGAERVNIIRDYCKTVYNGLLKDRQIDGELFLTDGYKNVQFSKAGDVLYQGKRIDIVMYADNDFVSLPPQLFMRLMGCHSAKKIFFCDSPLHELFGSKLLFATAHEMVRQGRISESNAEWIKRHIPFSVNLADEHVYYQGEKLTMMDFVRQHKDDFVLKKGVSAQGKDVMVGRFQTMDEWLEFVNQQQRSNQWLLQKYCEPERIGNVHSGTGLTEFDLVWGLFAADGRYAGGFGRVIPVDVGDGVINSSRGAKEITIMQTKI